MRTLLILITLAITLMLTACTELPDNPFVNDPPTPPVATSTTPPREPTVAGGVDSDGAHDVCGITVDRVYGCKVSCDRGQLCTDGQSNACLTECISGVAAGSWCPFPIAGS